MNTVLDKTKLHTEIHTTKQGVVTKKWIKNGEPVKTAKKVAKRVQNNWWHKYKEYDLSKYPTDMDEKDVKVNTEGDVDSHWVMTWVDKTGKIQHSYTREFMKRNAEKKWQTAAKFNDAVISAIKKKSRNGIVSEDDKMSQASAIIYIIANTGLRVGDNLNYERTGNRGVTTLHVDDVSVEGDTVHFDFKGKSHKQNHAWVKDILLAKTILRQQEVAKKEKSKFLFTVNRKQVDTIFKKDFKFSFKIKDMRTYIACSVAKTELYSDFDEVKQSIDLAETPKAKRKILIKKLNETFQNVANKLNNTPAMAKNSYVAPQIIEDYVVRLGISKEELLKAELEMDEIPTLEDIFDLFPPVENLIEIEPLDEEMCDEYPLPQWLQEIDFSESD